LNPDFAGKGMDVITAWFQNSERHTAKKTVIVKIKWNTAYLRCLKQAVSEIIETKLLTSGFLQIFGS